MTPLERIEKIEAALTAFLQSGGDRGKIEEIF